MYKWGQTMIQCYDWDNNVLKFEDQSRNKFNLCLKGNKTIICGESATGKSLICNILKRYMNSSNSEVLRRYGTSNLFIADYENIKKIGEQKNKLILIDRADILLTEYDVEIINNDTDLNRYIIFARKPLGIYLSPNYYAIMKREGDTTTIEYLFNVRGWN